MVEFRILGTVAVVAAGREVPIGEPRRSAVLAALLVDAGRVVAASTLIYRIWGEEPPERARTTLTTYITRLRQILNRASGQAEAGGATPKAWPRIVSESGGYRLAVDPDTVDLFRSRRLVTAARGADLPDVPRVESFRQAMALWRGEPLTGVSGDWARRTRDLLVLEHLDTAAGWANAELTVGNAEAVIVSLAELADAHPTMEPLTVMLMRALAAAGRPTEALRYGHEHRRRLAEEYGTDQGPELRARYEAILRGTAERPAPTTADAVPNPSGTVPTATDAVPNASRTVPVQALPAANATPGGVPTPMQLPADVPGFTGRAAELARLDELLDGTGEPCPTMTIAAICGTAGVGKTALAVHWAHRVAARFPDGQLYVNLRGFDPSGRLVDSSDAVRRLLEALGVPPHRTPTNLDAQAALYRSLLARRRMLVLLDNARDTGQLRPLLPGASGCMVLVTSRNQLAGLNATNAACLLTLDLLTASDARKLLECRLGPRADAVPSVVDELVKLCARLPVALTIVAARAAALPRTPLAVFVTELTDVRDRLDALATADDPAADLRAVLSWSYEQLDAATARLFCLLGLHPGPDVSSAAVASFAGIPVQQSRRMLTTLVRVHLVEEHLPDRFGFHDLLRAYAMEQLPAAGTHRLRREATHRMLDHYLHTAYRAERLLHGLWDHFRPAEPQPDVTPESLADRASALSWFAAERRVLPALVACAVAEGWDTHAWQLAWTMVHYLDLQGYLHDWVLVQRLAVTAADRLRDPAARSITRRMLALACINLGRHDEAQQLLRYVLDLQRQSGDRVEQAQVRLTLAMLLERQGHYAAALDEARHAYVGFQAADHLAGKAIAANNMGWCHTRLGNYDQAFVCCRDAVEQYEKLHNGFGEASAWDSLGYAYHHAGNHREAARCFRESLRLLHEVGDLRHQAVALVHLGDVHDALDEPETAREAWRQALDILDSLGHPDADAVRAKLSGR